MTQQIDLTIPFDASVLDEEALRALRAVQRTMPNGDGSAGGTLVGGTEAAAGLGMAQGTPTGAAALPPHAIAVTEAGRMPTPSEPAARPLDPAPNGASELSLDLVAPELALAVPAAHQSGAMQRRLVTPQASSYIPSEEDAPAREAAAPSPSSDPDDRIVVTPPVGEQPEPEEPTDSTAETPMLQVADAAGLEDRAIALDLSAALTDTDGSEVLSLTILGVPDGATLSHGTRQADGSWSVDPADLADLTITPPQNFSGSFELTIQATARETSTDAASTVSMSLRVRVEAVADAPVLQVHDAAGQEDRPVALDLSAALVDRDGSEVLSIVISGLPEGARLSAGLNNGDGSWTLTPAQLSGLTLTPPADWSGAVSITVLAHARETSNGSVATTRSTFRVQVEGAADAPSLQSADAAGREDEAIALNLSAALTDADGSETLAISIFGVPAGAALSHGSRQADGSWSIDPADLPHLALTPPHNFSGPIDLRVRATSREATGQTATTEATLTVEVEAVADTPSLHVADAAGREDSAIPVNVSAALTDTDGSEMLSVAILGVPAGAALSHGSRQPDGSWSVSPADLPHLTITPPRDFSGPIDLRVRATSREATGGSAVTEASLRVEVEAVADAPVTSAHDVTASEGQPIALDLSAGLTDRDGSELLSVSILGIPDGVLLSHGVRQADGSWNVSPADLAHLTLTAPQDYSGRFTLTLQATAREVSNGSVATARSTFQVQVDGEADAPDVSAQDARGHEDRAIALNLQAALTDVDGSEVLSVQILGVPDGAVLSRGSRQPDGSWSVDPDDLSALSITPPRDFSGHFELTLQASSRESATGAVATTQATFQVQVEAAADAPVVSARDATGLEDQPVSLDLSAVLADTDGSEVLSVAIFGVPAGATLSHGTRQPDGSWSVDPVDLPNLSLTPPQNFSGTIQLDVRATARETSNGSVATTHAPLQVRVAGVADDPTLIAHDAMGQEDRLIPLDLSAALTDTDGSEVLSIAVLGVPAGASLSHGSRAADGSWQVDPSDLPRLSLLPPQNFSGPIDLTVEAQASDGSTATRRADFRVQVEAVADAPVLQVHDAAGQEDRPIPLDLSSALVDTDGSEVLSIVLAGLPAGARLSAGTDNGDGTWTLAPSQLSDLTLTPPADWSGAVTLTATAAARETSNGSVATTRATFQVQAEAVADAPSLRVADAAGREDTPIVLNLSSALTDTDGSEMLSVAILGVPAGAALSHGTRQPDGSWSVDPADLPNLTLMPAPNWSGTLALSLKAVTTETSTGATSTRSLPFTVHVEAVADAPVVSARDASGQEDRAIPLDLSAALSDTDGSEKLSVSILGLPDGASLSHGTRQPDGSWSVAAVDLPHLVLTPPRDFSGTIDLDLQATTREISNGSTATTQARIQVQVQGVADDPSLRAHDALGLEDQAIPLDLSAALTDTDGSEVLSIVISGMPEGASLSHGMRQADGSWSVDPADLPHLSLLPPRNFSGQIDLAIEAETSEGSTASSRADFRVRVEAVADAPVLQAHDAAGQEDRPVALDLSAALVDRDGSEVLSIVISGLPEGARLSAGLNNGDGSWTLTPAQLSGLTLTPPADWSGAVSITVLAHARETSNGSVATTRSTFRVQVEGAADAPSLQSADAAGREDEAIALNLSAALTDADGSETLAISIFGVPAGAALSHGSRQADGSWSIDPADLPHLALTPPHNFSGPIDLRVRATSREATGQTATTEATLTVEVEAVADTPSLHVADAAGREDSAIPVNVSAALTDTDGSEMLSVAILGVPAGAALSHGSRQPDGSWSVSPADLPHLTITPPRDFSGPIDLRVRATSREATGGSAVTEASLRVEVEAVADAPVTSAGNVSGLEDNPIPLALSAALSDTDGSEALSASITGVPAGFSLSHGTRQADGSWSVDPADLPRLSLTSPGNFSGNLDLSLHVTSRESANGSVASRETPFRVHVQAVADAPDVVVRDFQGSEDQAVSLAGLGGALRDTDGSESLSFVLSGLPSGASLSAGTKQADGSWLLTPAQLTGLTLTPPANFSGSLPLKLTAVATEASDGKPTARTSGEFNVRLNPVLDTSSIGGNVSGSEDTDITLRPTFTLNDRDGSETWSEFTLISGVPAGAVLKGSTRMVEVSPGTWQVPTSDLIGQRIAIRPPQNSDNDFTLTFTATQTDTGNGTSVSRTVTGTSRVTVNAVADAPVATAANVAGNEDTAIRLNLSAALTDTDGSETLTVTILGVPAGAMLSHGTRLSNGNWVVQPADLPNVSLTPARDFSGPINLTLQATSRETNGGAQRTTTVNFQVQVEGVADAPGLRVSPAVGDEDHAIPLNVSAWTTDRDNSESLVAIRLMDVPDGAVVRAGGLVLTREPDGSVLVQPGAISTLTVTPPPNSDADFTLRVTAISAEPNGSRAESTPMTLPVTVRADADAPVMTVASASGSEDTGIPLNLAATLPDADGSETLSFVISGLPEGANLSAGTYRGPGVWSLTAEEARTVVLTPPADFAGTINLTVTAVSQERNGGDQASTRVTFPVTVGAVLDAPAVGGLDGTSGNWGSMRGAEDQPIPLRLDPGLADRDGSEKVVGDILIGGIPPGAVLRLADNSVVNAGPDGLYRVPSSRMEGVTLTMPHDSDQAATLTVRMTVEDSGGVLTTIGGRMVVDPAGDADNPVLIPDPSTGSGHNSTSADDGWIPLDVTAAPSDTDGSESLTIWIRDVPQGASLSAGIPAGNGVWLVPVASLPTLQIRPPAGFSGSFTLTVTAVATEREGDQAVRTEMLPVTVTAPAGGGTGGGDGSGTGPGTAPAAQEPVLEVSDAATLEDRAVPLAISADLANNDGGRETLGIRIDGVPAGARLTAGVRDPATGAWVLQPDQLDGVSLVPPANYSGTISLTVTAVSTEATGDEATTMQQLDIAVTAVADSAVISAAPATAAEDAAVALNLNIRPGDGDGSETVTAVLLSGLPAGARIEGAGVTDNGNGTWSVDPARLSDVRLIPPADRFGTFDVTVTATVREVSNGDTRSTSERVSVRVTAAADAPDVVVHDATGQEDRPVALNLSAALVDRDGSEVLSVVLTGLPEGARLSAGLNNGDGSWTLTPSQLSGLTLTPPADWSGSVSLTLLAHARETSNGSVSTTRATFQVQVTAEADAPVVSARDTTGLEDQPIPLSLAAALTDRDGSEVLSLAILGVPAGATLSHGTRQADGSWSVDPADLPHVAITPPQNFSGSFELTLRAISREGATGGTATAETTLRLQVGAVADAPDVVVRDLQGSEDQAVSLAGLGGALRDTDGSESLSFVLSGLPSGASLSAGTKQADGSWLLTPAQLTGLTLTPPANFSGQYALTLTGIATESTGGSARTAATFTVSVNPVVDAATTSGSSTGAEDTPILIKPTFTLQDLDGSEAWSAFTQVSGVPAGASLSHGTQTAPGVWQVATADLQAGRVLLQPAANSDNDFTLTLTATVTDSGAGTSASRVVTGTHNVVVTAVADAPVVTVHDAAGREDQPIPLELSAVLADTDGSEVLSLAILGVPSGATLSHGTRQPDGSWSVNSADLPHLALTPAPDWNGTLHLTLRATGTETGGQSATTTRSFTVTANAVNDAPDLAVTGASPVDAGARQADAFSLVEADDRDSARLGGATITLSGGQPGDSLDLDGYTLHVENGRMMVGDTGIEVVGGGFAAGTLTLSGQAPPETYAAVLQSLVLESGHTSGLAAGSRTIAVTLFDSEGAASTQRSVDVIVDEAEPPPAPARASAAAASSQQTQSDAGMDYLVLMSDDTQEAGASEAGSWTEQIDADGAPGSEAQAAADLSQPAPDPVQGIDPLQVEANRVHWT
ncbi:Ig-like domain-containing protein [Microvirga arsenatis]|uniref:RapA2 cadherin-like domain-containing protein n=1 Tax=Microvirga arsenatis TaxID=2692265 RepID=A0ABW9YYY4_9HYPH|nr:Ig-like domain-containing protein [Microvirga arsenatis]NBJ11112.1 hypothetical protein [Microvirga arsenatis]NBJ25385.1 hypothetical protein [Microvirga arsenatis]